MDQVCILVRVLLRKMNRGKKTPNTNKGGFEIKTVLKKKSISR